MRLNVLFSFYFKTTVTPTVITGTIVLKSDSLVNDRESLAMFPREGAKFNVICHQLYDFPMILKNRRFLSAKNCVNFNLVS